MAAFKHYYRDLGGQLWDIYGPRDFLPSRNGWIPIHFSNSMTPIR